MTIKIVAGTIGVAKRTIEEAGGKDPDRETNIQVRTLLRLITDKVTYLDIVTLPHYIIFDGEHWGT